MSKQNPTSDEPDLSEEQDLVGGKSGFGGLARHTLIYGIGIVLGRAVSVVMLPIYTRFLSTADYGVMALVEMSLDLIAILAGAQLVLGVFRYYHKADTEEDRFRIVSTSFMLVGVMYAVVGLLTFLLAGPLSTLVFGGTDQVAIIRIAAANLAMNALVIVPLSFLQVRDMSVQLVMANGVKLVLQVVFNLIFLVGMGLGVFGVFVSSLLANVLVGGVLSIWLMRTVGFGFSRPATRNLLRYGIPLMFTSFATFVATFGDRFFLQAYTDESTVGLYNLAYQFGFILATVGFTPFNQVWGPRRFAVAQRADSDAVLSRGFLYLNLLLVTCAVGIILFAGDVLRIMATPDFHPAAQWVPLIVVAYVLQSWAGVQDIGILVREKTEYITLSNYVSAGAAILGYALLIPVWGPWGAAIATVIAFAVRYLLTFYFSQRMWRVEYNWRPVVWLLGAGSVTCTISLLLPDLGILWSLTAHIGLTLVYLVTVWFLPILSTDERREVLRLLQSLKEGVSARFTSA